MRILIFNWKDIRHPFAGGAEYVTHQYAKHLVKMGHKVNIFTKLFPNAKRNEIIDGINITRQGNTWSLYFFAYFFYQNNKSNFDLIVDQIHGIPFFTPLYVKKPILAFIHEIAGEIWFKEFSVPFSFFGYVAEKYYFKLYKKVAFLTDSPSTKKELIKYGILPARITTIPLTIGKPKILKISKTKYPQLLYLGRLSAMKRIDMLIISVCMLKPKIPHLKLLIAGVGKNDYQKKLLELTHQLDLTHEVTFLGKIPEKHKWKFLRQSWIHINPSLKEGFGLTVLEAASQATPTIGFAIPGLSDLIKNGINGSLVKNETSEELANKISYWINNKSKLNKLSKDSRKWFSTWPNWITQTKKLEKLLRTPI